MPDIAGGDPFHAGERALQERAGVRERMAELGARAIREHMPAQHRDFFALLPWLVIGSIDDAGQPWASALAGAPGFVRSPDPSTLRVAALPPPDTPLAAGLRPGAPLGLLGLQPHTRRRNRMNGTAVDCDQHGFSVQVQQSFGNCPQYIHMREAFYLGPETPAPPEALALLDAEARALVGSADTLFIASAYPAGPGGGVDVSHRGGAPGFVTQQPDGTLLLPDYAGNLFFNTLGNLREWPHAGLLFIDFESGDLLQIAVDAELIWDGPLVSAHAGALRLLRLTPTAALRQRAGLALAWQTV